MTDAGAGEITVSGGPGGLGGMDARRIKWRDRRGEGVYESTTEPVKMSTTAICTWGLKTLGWGLFYYRHAIDTTMKTPNPLKTLATKLSSFKHMTIFMNDRQLNMTVMISSCSAFAGSKEGENQGGGGSFGARRDRA